MISTTSSKTHSKNTAIRLALSVALALGVWLITPVANAECPDGGQCYTSREAQTCLVCLNESEELRALARAKEEERNALAASLNITTGRLLESGDLLLKADADRMRLAVEVDARPTWWVVVGVGVGAILLGGVVGAVGF